MSNNIDYEEKIAFSQVYDILMLLDEEERKKIPKKFINFLKQNKLENYISTINPYIPLEMQKLENQTNAIISYIYIKYLADENEKIEFREKEKLEYEKEKQEIEERCKNMFNIPKKVVEVKEQENRLPIIKKNTNFFERIINKIKFFLYKDKKDTVKKSKFKKS